MALLLALSLMGCKDAVPADTAADCVADDVTCLLPYPSMQLLRADADTPTGWRIDLQEESLPLDIDGRGVDPWSWNEKDGFSQWGPLAFWMPDIDPMALPGHDQLGQGRDELVVVHAESGERVHAWLEADPGAAADPVVFARFAEPMQPGSRYIAAVQGVLSRDGGPAEAQSPIDAGLADELDALGVDSGALQLVWDFVTESREHALAPAMALRDYTRAEVAPEFRIAEVIEADCELPDVFIGRTLRGKLTTDSFMAPGTHGDLFDRSSGLPTLSHQITVPFVVQVPCSLLEAPRSGLVVHYGHGLLTSRNEVAREWMQRLQDERGWIVAGVNWGGLASTDRNDLALMVAENLGNFAQVPEGALQGFVENDALRRLLIGPLAHHESTMVDGVRLLGPEVVFYGISAGGVMGAGYLGWSERYQRAALGVPGAGFSTLLPRSKHFTAFEQILDSRYPDRREVALYTAMFQTLWGPGEAAGWTWSVAGQDGAAGTQVLIQQGSGDAQVAAIAGQNLARAVGAELIGPSDLSAWELPATDPEQISGSALSFWRFTDAPTDPVLPLVAELATDTHLCVRQDSRAQEQLVAFFERGEIIHTCDGPCEALVADCEGF